MREKNDYYYGALLGSGNRTTCLGRKIKEAPRTKCTAVLNTTAVLKCEQKIKVLFDCNFFSQRFEWTLLYGSVDYFFRRLEVLLCYIYNFTCLFIVILSTQLNFSTIVIGDVINICHLFFNNNEIIHLFIKFIGVVVIII